MSAYEGAPAVVTRQAPQPFDVGKQTKAPAEPLVWFQVGAPRTATTLQFMTLCAFMVLLHSDEATSVSCSFMTSKGMMNGDRAPRLRSRLGRLRRDGKKYFVVKTHEPNVDRAKPLLKVLLDVCGPRTLFFFTEPAGSGSSSGSSLPRGIERAKELSSITGVPVKFTQIMDEAISRGHRIAEDYKFVFDLRPSQIEELIEWLGHWDVLRQCCGVQMSKSWRAFLLNQSQEPHRCAGVNLDAEEAALLPTRVHQLLGGLDRASNRDYPFNGKYCSWFEKQLKCQHLDGNERPRAPFCSAMEGVSSKALASWAGEGEGEG